MDRVYLRTMTELDSKAVLDIYELGILSKNATFETKVPSWEKWDQDHLDVCRIVACVNNTVVGWICLSPVSKREVFQGVAEVSVYVHPDYHGRGVGSLLMEGIIKKSEAEGFWTLQANIFPNNQASLTLHQKYGFTIVGVRKKIGLHYGKWRDIVLLERRSPKW